MTEWASEVMMLGQLLLSLLLSMLPDLLLSMGTTGCNLARGRVP